MIIENTTTIDSERLGRYLEQHLPHFQGPLRLDPFTAGRSNPTFMLTAASGRYVLRTRPRAPALATAHQIDREFRIQHALQAVAVPTPRVLHLCTDDAVLGRPFYVMTFLEGSIEEDPILPAASVTDRGAMFAAAVDALAQLHTVDFTAIGLADYGRPAHYMPRQVKRWTTQFRAAQTQDHPTMERLMHWLERHCPDADRATLVHGDYRFGNLMFAPRSPRLLAILDWELSTLGDPFCDLAYFCQAYYTPRGHEPLAGIAGVDRAPLGIPELAPLIARYCSHAHAALPSDWHAYLAFAFFRMAAIAHGVYARLAQRSGRAALSAIEYKAVESTADLGLRIALDAPAIC